MLLYNNIIRLLQKHYIYKKGKKMKRRTFFTTAGTIGAGLFSNLSCTGKTPEKETGKAREKLFSFVHFTDIHVQPEKSAREGFLASIDKMNSLKPDLAISGGDLVMDALAVDETRANMLYDMYSDCCRRFEMPVYDIIGNHDLFGIYVPDKVPVDHPEWGSEMFRRRLGEGRTYRSFDHKGVHFVLLDSMQLEKNTDKPGYKYYNAIGAEQMAWLRNDIGALPADTSVIAVSHIPLFTRFVKVIGPLLATPKKWKITDGKELYDILTTRRLLGLFQGHIHVNEVYEYKQTKFVDGGAVCGSHWSEPYDGHPEGFNLVDVYEDGIETTYTTYGWDGSKYA